MTLCIGAYLQAAGLRVLRDPPVLPDYQDLQVLKVFRAFPGLLVRKVIQGRLAQLERPALAQ
jgi:hypothetical protein